MNKTQKLKYLGIGVAAVLLLALIGAFALSRVNVAYASGFISKKNLDLRVKQVQFAYDLQTMGTMYQDPDYAANAQRGILEQMVAENLLMRQASKSGISVTDQERQQHIDELMSWLLETYFYGSEEFLLEILAGYELTKPELESYLVDTLAVYKLREQMGADIIVDDDQARLYYDAHSDHYNFPEMIRVSHILVEDLESAQDILAQIRSGKSFAELAEIHSLDYLSGAMGGELGIRPRGYFVSEFDDAAWEMSTPGQLSEPIETQYGYHVIRFDEKIAARDRSYQEVEELVKEDLWEELEEIMWANYLEELRARSRFFIFLR